KRNHEHPARTRASIARHRDDGPRRAHAAPHGGRSPRHARRAPTAPVEHPSGRRRPCRAHPAPRARPAARPARAWLGAPPPHPHHPLTPGPGITPGPTQPNGTIMTIALTGIAFRPLTVPRSIDAADAADFLEM